MKKAVLAGVLLGFVAVYPVPVRAQKSGVRPAMKRSYVRKDLGFALNSPSGWLPSKLNSVPGMVIGYYQDTGKRFQPVIGVRAQTAPGPVMPPDLEQVMDRKYRDFYPSYTSLGTARFKLAGKDAVSIAFTHREQTTDTIVDTRHVYVVHRGKLMMFEVAATVDQYDEAVAAFDKMMKSVTFQP